MVKDCVVVGMVLPSFAFRSLFSSFSSFKECPLSPPPSPVPLCFCCISQVHDTRVTKRQRNQNKHTDKEGDAKKRKEGEAEAGTGKEEGGEAPAADAK